jgi:hypothetical protein
MRLSAAVTVALLLGVSPALAQPSRTPPVPAPYQVQPAPWQPPPLGATETHRYGSKIALADGLSFGAMLVGVVVLVSNIDDSNDEGDAALGAALMIGGAAGYAFGGPLIHSSEGNRSGAWKSFALRVGLPLLGSAIGEAMREQQCGPDYCTENTGPSGSLGGVGVVTAMVVDWFVLARVERPVYGYAPYAATGRDGGVTVGLAGAF